ncbi:tRNA (adenosine(37)-N6)-threonylcarbamoyltransferase complex ATPase subunit type 1 TsaE [Candidatus Uhrbacteria bacterium]|nr:tRNA (adenosine(37)-N6)-threonylcarbamoyltransferase complex ATPase subunit type 1 TsaE [Candidatus Uhrbacteria bacterium]
MMYQSHNEEETKQIARRFASTLKGGETVFLKGDLGTGKTTFVRGVAEYFGFGGVVRSPTFTIMNRYSIDQGPIKVILHMDFYRIEDPSEFTALALEEELGRPDTIAFIEWPEKDTQQFVFATYQIHFSCTGSIHEIEY